ncbi:MAG: PorT family protein [Hymenobacteraceae bacterium]|nr:PorT family protein [Hymenobacteraceae bacterium]
MKHVFTLLICFLFGVVTVQAQEGEPRLRLGAKVGLNLFHLSDDDFVQEDDAGLAAEFGVFGRIGERFYVQPELNFVGHKIDVVTVDQPRLGERDDVAARYIRIPVLLGYRTRYGGGLASSIRYMIGPSYSFLVDVKDNNLGISRSDIRNSQFALNGGVGFELWVLNLDIMYHHYFSSFFDRNGSDGKGRAFSLSAGIAF